MLEVEQVLGGHTCIIVSEAEQGGFLTYDCGATAHWQGRNGEPYLRGDSFITGSGSRPSGIIIRGVTPR